MVDLEIIKISKTYSKRRILDSISLSFEKGKLYTILGPSGCGKTTLLKIITGIEPMDSGQIILQREEITNKPTPQRNIGMVFQNYALFNHLSVYKNLAFGLKSKKMDHDLIKRKITEGLKFISLESSFLDRNISSLSGGEKQRVALLRTILTEPRILLLDEPLSNVDASLKETLREEIRELQKNLQITTIMVTHDKEDAFAISDEIAILLNKKIAQTGSPNYVYDHPSDYEVAKFLGSHQLFKGVLIENDGNQVKVEIGRNVHFHAIVHENEHFKINEELIVGIKSERLIIEPVDQYGSEFSLRGKICHVHILGPMVRYYVQLSEGLYIDVLEKNTGYSKPEELEISLQYVVDDVVLFSQKGRKYK